MRAVIALLLLALQEAPLKPLEFLAGEWKADAGTVVHAFKLGGKFLQSDWSDAEGNPLGRTMIGCDPVRVSLAIWTFGRDGAAGRGALVESAEGKVWTFAGRTGDAHWRQTIRKNDDGTFLLMMEMPDEDGVWAVKSMTTYSKP